MSQEAKKTLYELSQKNRVLASKVKCWQKIFWMFYEAGLAWRVRKKCLMAIRAINQFDLIEAKHIVMSIRDSYTMLSAHRFYSSPDSVFPKEMSALSKAILEL